MQNIIDHNKDVYNKIAKLFADTRKFIWDDLKPLKKYTKDGDRVLDLGCGGGRLYQLFKGLSIEYIGVDNSEEQIKVARQNYLQAKFEVGQMTDLQFDDNYFDIIYCIAAFHHLPDKKTRLQALREMKRVLKPGGYLIMTNWGLLAEWGQAQVEKGKYKDIGDNNFLVPWKDEAGNILGERFYHGFTLEELEELFGEAGFEVEEQYLSGDVKWTDEKKGKNLISIAKLQ